MRDANNNMDEQIGRRLRTARLNAHVSVEQLSEIVGMTVAEWHSLESGRSRVDAAIIARIAKVLGIEVRQFFSECCNVQQAAAIELIKSGKTRPALQRLIRKSKERGGGLRAA